MIVMVVPPLGRPLDGVMLEIVGASSLYVKAEELVAVWLSGFVTATETRPLACVGVTAVSEVSEIRFTFVAPVPPTVTVGCP